MKDKLEAHYVELLQDVSTGGTSIEARHMMMDRLLLDFLCNQGYGRIVDAYIKIQNEDFPYANWYGRRI